MLINIIFLAITISISLFIIFPILQAKTTGGRKRDSHVTNNLVDLHDRKETIYAAIKDIEFDFQMGKLSEDDFAELRNQYKSEAIELLKKIKRSAGPRKPKNTQRAPIEQQQQGKLRFCWHCGYAIDGSDNFCGNCGNDLH